MSMEFSPYLVQAINFVRSIGIEVEIRESVSGFIDHALIENGRLIVDPKCPVSGLLHEAGHIAIVPRQFHHLLSGNLYNSLRAIFESEAYVNAEIDSPLSRAILQISDPEVTAWAFAAGRHLGIPDDLIIMDHEYDGSGEEIRLRLQWKEYFGINGLAHAGFCALRKLYNPKNLAVYPELSFWVQEAA